MLEALKRRQAQSQNPHPNKNRKDAAPDTTCVPQGSMGANPSLRHPRLIRCFEDRWEQTRCFVCYPSYRYSKRHVRSVRSSPNRSNPSFLSTAKIAKDSTTNVTGTKIGGKSVVPERNL